MTTEEIKTSNTTGMKTATGISKWTSENRNHAVHIINDNYLLCGMRYFSYDKHATFIISNVTCKKCLLKYNKLVKDAIVNNVDENVGVIISQIQSSIKDCIDKGDSLNAASWGYQEGVLMSANDALILLQHINAMQSYSDQQNREAVLGKEYWKEQLTLVNNSVNALRDYAKDKTVINQTLLDVAQNAITEFVNKYPTEQSYISEMMKNI